MTREQLAQLLGITIEQLDLLVGLVKDPGTAIPTLLGVAQADLILLMQRGIKDAKVSAQRKKIEAMIAERDAVVAGVNSDIAAEQAILAEMDKPE